MSLALFRSIRFNLLLFALILSASALGTFVPQLGEAPQKVDAFAASHPFWARAFEWLGLFDLYHAPWFIALLALMAFDVAACKLYNAPPDADLGLPREMVENEEDRVEALSGKPYRATFAARGSTSLTTGAEDLLDGAARILRGRGYSAAVLPGAAPHVLGSRQRLQRWGSYFAHIGLVVLLAGTLLKALFGFEEMLPVMEGGSKVMKHRPWEVHVDKFDVQYYAGTATPKRFSSDIRVYDKTGTTNALEEGELLAEKRILVNEPVSLPGAHGLGMVRLYQASWGATGMVRSATLAVGDKTLEIPMGAKVRLPGTAIEVSADVMMPDFTVSAENRAETLSLEPVNPAVKVTFYKDGQPTAPLWLVQNFPEAVFVEDEKGILHQGPRPPFRLAAVDPMLFSGLQIAYDPGIPVLYGGFAMFMAGLCALFYMHRRKVWVWVVEGAPPRLVVGGWSSRRDAFHGEFTELVGALRAELG